MILLKLVVTVAQYWTRAQRLFV